MKLTVRTAKGPVEVEPSLVVGGLDYGYGPSDPLALEVVAKVGRVWVNFYEVYRSHLSVVEVLREVMWATKTFGVERIWADSEDARMNEYLQSHGLPVIPNQVKDVSYGIRTFYSLLKQQAFHPLLGEGPRFRVDRAKCPGLLSEMQRYAYGAVKGELTGKPLDRYNHAVDSVRYAVTGEGEAPPEVYVREPWERPPMTIGVDGKWRDDPEAQMARFTDYRHDDLTQTGEVDVEVIDLWEAW